MLMSNFHHTFIIFLLTEIENSLKIYYSLAILLLLQYLQIILK